MSYAKERQTALRMIKKKGALVTVKRALTPTADATDKPLGPTELTYTCYALIVPNFGAIGSSYGAALDGLRVRLSDKLIIAAASPGMIAAGVTEPLPGDIASFRAKDWVIDSVARTGPDGDLAILFNCPTKI